MRSHGTIQIPSVDWYRASFCQNGECVEIAAQNGVVIMRSSAEPDSGQIRFTPEEFGCFLREAKAGGYDLIV
jgi:hypothetical protein